MNTIISQKTYFVKKFISSFGADYEIYDMTFCNSFNELDLQNKMYYVSTNYELLEIDENFKSNNFHYLKLFDLNLSFYRSFYLKYSGIFEMTTNYPVENKDEEDCSPQYIKLIISATNLASESNIHGDLVFNIDLLESSHYRNNIIYICNDDNTISFWFKSRIPCNIVLHRKDNDKTSNIFELELLEMSLQPVFDNVVTLK